MSDRGHTVLRVAGLVFLALVAGLAVYFGSRTTAPSATPVKAPRDAQIEVSAPDKAVTLALEPTVVPNTETPTPPVPVAAAGSSRLTGTWELVVTTEEGESYPAERYELDDRKSPMTAVSNDGYTNEVALDGMQLRIVSKLKDIATLTFTGTLNAAYTEASGTYESVYRIEEPAPRESRQILNAQLVRITRAFLEDERHAEELRQRRFAQATELFTALDRFAKRNDGKLPGSLSQLTTDDLADRALVANQSGRRITYTGGGGVNLTLNEDIGRISREFDEKGTSTESLVEYERKLREVWGGESPFTSRVLRIEYENPSLVIDVAASGVMRSSDEEETQALGDDTSSAALRESEFNNLKQLMIVCKMFLNENKDHLPGGWLMVYPEYLTDPDVLRSPWAPEGTSSYELLFPGETEKRLEELAQQLIDSGALHAETASQSIIPTIAARDNLPAEPGQPPARAVAFLDGHVEAVPLAEWDTRIAPFLR